MSEPEPVPNSAAPSRDRRLPRLAKWITAMVLAMIALLAAAVLVLNSPIGKRFIVDRIAQFSPVSGLKIDIGRIEGDIYGKARLNDVTLSDPKGPFLKVPLVDLDWRPLSWVSSGLDVRELATHRGTLLRLPELIPGDPDAPILPNFDIRVDRLAINNLSVAEGVVGDGSPKVNLLAKIDIRSGRALVKADGRLGDRDRLHALLDAAPDRDNFDLELDYDAPRAGVIAGLIGAQAGYRARISGDGSWRSWKGGLSVTRDSKQFAAFRLTNEVGVYGILGQIYPEPALSGTFARLAGDKISLGAEGTLDNSVLDGKVTLRSPALDLHSEGAVDLAGNEFENLELAAKLRNANALSPGLALRRASLTATLDGEFRDLAITHALRIGELQSGATRAENIRQTGSARYDGSRFLVPIDARVGRVSTGNAWVDPQLVDGRVAGRLLVTGDRLASDALAIRFPGADARLAMRGNVGAGTYRLTGPVNVAALSFDNVGTVGGRAQIDFRIGEGSSWSLRADFDGQVTKVTNATLANLAGPVIRFKGEAGFGGGSAPLTFRRFAVSSDKLSLRVDGRIRDGTTTLSGSGRHIDYGPFTVEADIAAEGPRAVLVFANPLPAAGLTDVRVALAPSEDGFKIDTEGGSILGPFTGSLNLVAPANGPTRIAIGNLRVWQTDVTGNLVLVEGGANGLLSLSGGGLKGTITLAPRGGGQGFDADLTADGARFAGPTPLTIARADIDLSGSFAKGRTRLQGNAVVQGVTYGSLFIGRIAARADLENGRGKVVASVSGRRGSRFNLDFDAMVAPERIALAAKGTFAGEPITLSRRAILTSIDGGGWDLSRTQVNYGKGRALIEGQFGAGKGTAFKLQLADMPLALADIAFADLGLGGSASGIIDYQSGPDGIPVADARVKIAGLRRSGLVLTSQPIDVALALELTREQMRMRAAIDEGGERRGRVQARIMHLPKQGSLAERLRRSPLVAQLRYDGPAESLWRLAAVDAFDLAGNLRISADAYGTVEAPRVGGAVVGDNLRFQSALTGTSFRDVSVRGRFDGSRLTLSRLSGKSGATGSVTGSGIVDIGRVGEIDPGTGSIRGPGLDIKLAAKNARLIDANGLSAMVTGPLRIISTGTGGTIAGRVSIDRASWQLGTAASAQAIPRIRTREINVPANIAPARAPTPPWRFLIDARGRSRIDVDGMGLDSEWGADLRIRGTTLDPRIGGRAQVVRGSYSFAGTRFELTRGQIDFDDNAPINPRLDIRAETEREGLTVVALVRGTAVQPEISFTSSPALPEEELLSRLLFGNSITNLSATDALQLGAAVASLRGGGGMDPINRLRSAIGLDRLRIVSADPALNQGTGVALGKNIGRRFYVEVVTDGKGYSATQVEFRITSWAALLASVSTLGRNSVTAEISKDY